MFDRGKNNRFKNIFFNQKFLSLIGLIVIISISFPFTKNAIKQYRINKEISDFKKEIATLENKNLGLTNLVSFYNSDQFAEEQARLNLNLKKSGEELTVIKTDVLGLEIASSSGDNQDFNISGQEKEDSSRELSNPRKWLNLFLK